MARSATGLVVATVRQRRAGLMRGTALQAACVLVFALPAAAQPAPNARPTGGQVVAGTAVIGGNANTTTITQASQRAAIDWHSFNVGSQQSVQFNQPGASAVTLNRVTGPDPSAIAGRITANGGIIITNRAGVVFHGGAQVDAASLVVSAPGISNQNFMAGRMVFDQRPNPNAAVVNNGTITVKEAGLAALVAPRVANAGVINARLGRAVLAGAATHTIDLYGDGLLSIDVGGAVRQVPLGPDGNKVTALVTNTGTVIADGGVVQITARAADGIVQNLVEAGGRIQANTAAGHAGRIAVAGVGGSVRIEGRLAADGWQGQPGGRIEIASDRTVALTDAARVSADGSGGGGTVALGATLARAASGRAAALAGRASPGTPAGTARQLLVAPGASVSASGRGTGSGGTVVALSTQQTRIQGRLAATGGKRGGNGGVIEASSDEMLQLTGATDAGAPSGKGGTLYLDPFDLIVGTGTPTAGFDPFGDPSTPAGGPPTTGTSYVSPATLEAASRGGTARITLQASHDLTVAESVNLATGTLSPAGGTSGAALSLQAGHDLTIAANVNLGTARGDSGVPDLQLTAGHQLFIAPTSAGDPVRISGFGDIVMSTPVAPPTSIDSSISIRNGTVIDTGGAILFRAAGRIDIGGDVVFTAGPSPSGSTGQTGIDLLAGAVMTVSTNSRFQLRTDPAVSVSPQIRLAAGGTLDLSGTGIGIEAGSSGQVVIAGGSAIPGGLIRASPAPDPAGSVRLAAGHTVHGLGVAISSGSAGFVQLGAGGSATGDAGLQVSSGAGGTTIGGTLATGATLGATLTLNSGGAVAEDPTGALVAPNLQGAAGSFALTSRNNRIDQVGAGFGQTLRATAGDVALVDSVNLVIGSRGGSPGGGIAVPAGHTIGLTTDDLTLGSGVVSAPGGGSGVLFATAGTIAVQPFTEGRPVELQNGAKTPGLLSLTQDELTRVRASRLQLGSAGAGELAIGPAGATVDPSAPVDGVGNGITLLELASAGPITQTADLVVPALIAHGGSVTLTNAGNRIGALGASGASVGDFALTSTLIDAAPLQVLGAVAVPTGRTIALTADRFSLADGGALSAPGGTVALAPLSAGTTIDLAGFVGPTATITADTLRVGSPSTGAIQITGAFALGATPTLDLRAAGAITEAAGASLEVARLTGVAAGATLAGDNRIGTLAAFGTSTGFRLRNAATLAVGGPVTDATSIALDVVGDLALAGDLRAPEVSLVATGAITQGTGTIAADLLTGSAGSAALTSATNQVAAVGPFTAGTLFALTDGRSLTVAGTIDPPDVTLTVAGDLAITRPIVGNRVTLLATGAIGESGEGSVTAATLTGSAGTATFDLANRIDTLDRFATTSGLTLVDSTKLTVTGPVTDGSGIAISSEGGLRLAGTLTAPNIALVALAGPDGAGDLTQSAGALTAAGTISLTAAGGIRQTAGSIAAGTLTGSAAGAAGLTGGDNHVTTLGDFSTGGGFALTDAGGLVVAGAVQDPASVRLDVGGSLVLNGTVWGPAPDHPAVPVVDLAAGGDVTLANTIRAGALSLVSRGGNIAQTGGALQAATLTGAATGSANLTSAANAVGSLGAFTTSTGLTLENGAALTVSGSVSDAAAVQIHARGGLTVTQDITAPVVSLRADGGITQSSGTIRGSTAVSLVAGGSIAQPGGFLVAGSLTVDAGGDVGLGNAGLVYADTLSGRAGGVAQFGVGSLAAVRGLGGFTAGSLTLASQLPLTVTGPLRAGTLTLSAPGSLTVQGGSLRADTAVLGVTAVDGAPATLTQTGVTASGPDTAAVGSLRLRVIGGGTIALADLEAGSSAVTLDLGAGAASGTLVAGALQVNGSGGSAALFGSVAGQTGFGAAAVATIAPRTDAAYQFNLCTITTTCGLVPAPPPPTPPAPPPAPPPPAAPFVALPALAAITPKSFLDTTLGSIFKPFLFTVDLITIGIVRDPTDPDLVLPNISDRDY